MATSPISIRIAQAIGLTGAAWLSGNIAGLSLISVPALSSPPNAPPIPSSTLAKQWRTIYLSGKAQNPPIAAIIASSFVYLAWTLRSSPSQSRLYGIAACLTIGIVPWTLLTMGGMIEKLLAQAEGSAGGEKEFGELLKKWTLSNGVRSLFPLVGCLVGMLAVLG